MRVSRLATDEGWSTRARKLEIGIRIDIGTSIGISISIEIGISIRNMTSKATVKNEGCKKGRRKVGNAVEVFIDRRRTGSYVSIQYETVQNRAII